MRYCFGLLLVVQNSSKQIEALLLHECKVVKIFKGVDISVAFVTVDEISQ